MEFRAICAALALSSLPIVGCGTAANLIKPGPEEGGKTPFGGVRQDVACIKKASNGELGPRSESEQYPQLALMLFCAADLPFSLIGDAVMWPYTVAYTYINQPVPAPPVVLAPVDNSPQTAPPEPPTKPDTLPKPTKLP